MAARNYGRDTDERQLRIIAEHCRGRSWAQIESIVGMIAVTVDGVRYDSVSSAARAKGIHRETMTNWIRTGKASYA